MKNKTKSSTKPVNKTNFQRLSTRPLNVPRSMRGVSMRALTSLPAGKVVPIGIAGLLREDSVRRGSIRYSFEMMETAEILMNAVQVRVQAHFVPFLAFDRFVSMDELNKSYMGVPVRAGDDVIPFVETIPYDRTKEFYKYAGIHSKQNGNVNSAYLEAYNQIWNYRATNRSPNLTHRNRLQDDLAPAFWDHDTFQHVVPDFDSAKIEGAISVGAINSQMPVKGIGVLNDLTFGPRFNKNNISVRESDGTISVYPTSTWSGDTGTRDGIYIKEKAGGLPDIYAELQSEGIQISLANIDLARKTQAFAKLREQYSGYDDVDEYLIDLLMQGINVPEQDYRQPMLLAEKTTVFGMSKRYATDAGNLAESAVNGATYLDLNIRVPKMTTGGVLMVTAEIVPDQLWERQKDPFLHAVTVDHFPQALRDELDPEKVEEVTNDVVDVDHDTPDDIFGYGPLNFRWNMNNPRIGGKFFRPQVDASFDEDRQRLWAVETQNPTLNQDFYLATQMHTKPFADSNQDPFEVVGVGTLVIEGNTVFGHKLIEASDDYQKTLAIAPQEKITK